MNRRGFLSKTSLAALSAAIGTEIFYGAQIPAGYRLIAEQDPDLFARYHKDRDMVILNKRPINIEARAHLLNDDVTPERCMFVRNNGKVPVELQAENWELLIDGESVRQGRSFSLEELKTTFPHYSYNLTLECGGNGRSEFDPPAKGNQWTVGAVSCATWTGVRLRDVLREVGIKQDAVYVGYHAADLHLSGDPRKEVISRGIPMAKAMQEETLLAFEMNGKPIPEIHGFPLRLVAGGWPASVSGKWLKGLSVRNQVHDGPKMESPSYRVPCDPVAPGTEVADENMCIIESMPVKSLITYPRTGAVLETGRSLRINGHAWAGELQVKEVSYSIDFGATWQECTLDKPVNRLAWQNFRAAVTFPSEGYYEIWARATDSRGVSQPMVLPGWNPKGYLNNACHRIAVKVV
ncbi:sulfite oxidase [Zeaxanthinibacter enoshimensis]|uniref:DMSO/TMAO reductase YedYZ molybdopterin-dependent catalytic subunit n=1 Tax=Zeaxanthinibacter enoshimensis TaxID=392009 RepID=A0A4R6TTQ3_9FLAO|nr:sulfite oxidase [Zeaxanthinibacter enoshimensis]TDQ32328.1 DMSO/TMAO reductase YedYZ molybdopterin-dependent catalytic subunit [Zeaxanthinibacter enoshimensis]